MYSLNRSLLVQIQEKKQAMIDRLIEWASINSHPFHCKGLSLLCEKLMQTFSSLGETVERVPLPPWKTWSEEGEAIEQNLGEALLIRQRITNDQRILLVGHMDTVFSPNHPFQSVRQQGDSHLIGPGVTDMKGGLVILSEALTQFESTPFAKNIGWDLLITPDEEIGSPQSTPLLQMLSKTASLAFVFEPSLPDGALVSERKGSANYILISEGQAAHAGREIDRGKNAIVPLARTIHYIDSLPIDRQQITINIGTIHGGTTPNVVPHQATCRINIRFLHDEFLLKVEQAIKKQVEQAGLFLYRETYRPPKPLTPETEKLLQHYSRCAKEWGTPIDWRPSGGVCDGNTIAAMGIPTLDTLGAVGNHIHQEGETIELESLVVRTQIFTDLLFRLAQGDISWPPKKNP